MLCAFDKDSPHYEVWRHYLGTSALGCLERIYQALYVGDHFSFNRTRHSLELLSQMMQPSNIGGPEGLAWRRSWVRIQMKKIIKKLPKNDPDTLNLIRQEAIAYGDQDIINTIDEKIGEKQISLSECRQIIAQIFDINCVKKVGTMELKACCERIGQHPTERHAVRLLIRNFLTSRQFFVDASIYQVINFFVTGSELKQFKVRYYQKRFQESYHPEWVRGYPGLDVAVRLVYSQRLMHLYTVDYETYLNHKPEIERATQHLKHPALALNHQVLIQHATPTSLQILVDWGWHNYTHRARLWRQVWSAIAKTRHLAWWSFFKHNQVQEKSIIQWVGAYGFVVVVEYNARFKGCYTSIRYRQSIMVGSIFSIAIFLCNL